MKKQVTMLTLAMLCAYLTTGGTAFAQVTEKDSVAYKLLVGEKQLQPWADELEKQQPETLNEAWDAMEVFLRAKRDEAVIQLLPRAYEFYSQSESFGKYDPRRNAISDALLKLSPERGKIYIKLFEIFGAVFSPFEVDYHKGPATLLKFMRHAEWGEEQITEWLRERYEASQAMDAKQIPLKRGSCVKNTTCRKRIFWRG